ncbi:glycoside hydrolase family 2 TIM barrel-domain containing protein [Asticcacaulis sp. BYS171W]|uniref:Glycoside hydrolase family 2 TIM barrel-domain containing protein n=1 Tax=Asticcacaulis aquaticus TaxID=2984212 RepID=A0ABT5HYF5_9CAUL|nr:beta-galactosidase GalA [Asticcacaulis aquaticus]MDC7685110.1 glycoside hydrolase family 2 TIM barrel-domain containing protein [Asticcacaulis aquaticus]
MTSLNRRRLLQSAAIAGAAATSPALAAKPANSAPVLDAFPQPDLGPRERIRLDLDWRFHFGHAADMSKDFGYGLDLRTHAKQGARVATNTGHDYDDSGWRRLDLPHDWAVELPFVNNPNYTPTGKPDEEDMLAAHGYKPLGRDYPDTSIGWYRKVVPVSPADKGKRLWIEFDGVFRDCVVIFNGFLLKRHESGYTSFQVDITDFINTDDKPNILTVRVDATQGEGWFYEGAGIYRHVWLVKTNAVHIPQWGVWVRGKTDGTVEIETTVRNASDGTRALAVTSSIGPTDRPTAFQTTGGTAEPDQTLTVRQTLKIADPVLWSIETPHLYKLVTTVGDGKGGEDTVITFFGLRDIRFDSEKGFLLNEKPVKLKGTNNHQDHAGVGAAIPDALQLWRLQQLKEMGSNAYRCSHNPPTPEVLMACDRLGILVIDETRKMSSSEDGLYQLDAMIRRDRNHPSVIAWSICNEEPLQGTTRGIEVGRTMKALCKRLDPTRPVTAALDNSYGKGITSVVDVLGFNYRHGQMEKFHADFPNLPIYGSETGSTVSTRGEYVTDAAKSYVRAYDTEHPWWASTAEAYWPLFDEKAFIAGGFIWTGFDYRGEPTPYNRWPSISSHFGVLDTCGFPKDNYYYYRAWWKAEPLLHLFPHWNWAGKEGETIPVWVHSNLDAVELFVNGKSAGKKAVVRNRHLEWDVVYQPGKIQAFGYKDGKVVLKQTRETAGDAVKLVLTADRNTLKADGQDVAVLRVEAFDAKGRPVPRADQLVTFDITGPGAIIGVGNGNPTSHEPDKASKRHLFNGLAQAIVQSGRSGGTIRVTATATGLTSAQVVISTT